MLSMPRIVRPDPHRFWRARNLGPPLDQPLADPLSETKNWRNHLIESIDSQAGTVPEKELASERARNGDSPPISHGTAD